MAPGLTSGGGRLPLARSIEGGGGGGGEGAGEGAGEGEGAEGVSNNTEGLDEDGHWTRELVKGEPVVVLAEGKTEACAVGFLLMDTQEVREKGKGPVIEDAHYLGDGLWMLGTV